MQRTLQLAKDHAQSGFAILAKGIVADADANIMEALTAARSAMDQSDMRAARNFLRADGETLANCLDVFYRNYLDRAMQTMYNKLRPDLHNFSAMELTLIDDETMNRQIEVDRLTVRMRDADTENLGKINLMISQMHGEHDAKERENPFRPYLLANTLHEVLKELVTDEGIIKVLFHFLSDALTKRVPAFYSSIRDAFESTGVHATLTARPSMLSKGQRDLLAQKAWRSNLDIGLAALGSHQEAPPSADLGFADLVRQIFNLPQLAVRARAAQPAGGAPQPVPQSQETRQPHESAQAQKIQQEKQTQQSEQSETPDKALIMPASEGLLKKLNHYQQMAAAGKPVNDQISVEQNQLFAVREEIGTDEATSQELVTIELIALLFSSILMDEQISVSMREKIGRLQIPFLKAAMIEPEVLQNTRHPARLLLNRMGSVAINLDPETPLTQEIEKEITRIADNILAKFDRDMAIFTECLGEFEQFIVQELQSVEPAQGEGERASPEMLEEVEKICMILAIVTKAFDDVIEFMIIDGRIVDFIMQTWTRVVAWTIYREMASDTSLRGTGPASMPTLEILPELVWSAQVRPTNQDRSALMRFLPSLVLRLKNGLKSIQLNDEKYQHALDQLVSVHTEVLGANQMVGAAKPTGLEELQRQFATLAINDRLASMGAAGGRIIIQPDIMESVLAERKASARLFLESAGVPSLQSSLDWLAQLQLGTCVTCHADGTEKTARLFHVSSRRQLYMFKPDDNSDPMIFSSDALSKASREGTIVLLESAPLFERAVEAIMTDAEAK